jgi:hypothetical protein
MFWNSTSVRTALKSSPPFGEDAMPSPRHVTKYSPLVTLDISGLLAVP